MRTVDCPTCHGVKTVNVSITEYGKEGVRYEEMTCVVCNGTGVVTQGYALAVAAHLADWCQCEDSAREHIRFYMDGEHPKCHKHHYRHEPGCGKIVQIG